MTKKEHVHFWHKKHGKEAGVNALARRGSMNGAKPVGHNPKMTPAQLFMKNLRDAIRQANMFSG